MAVSENAPLRRSIRIVLGGYSLTETLVFCVISRIFSFPLVFVLLFLAAQGVFHLGIFVFLIRSASLFYIISTKERLNRINTANKITLFRITMLPFLLFLILAFPRYPVGPVLLPVIALTFITDLADGYVSRAKNEVTFIGKILDSASDYLLLLVAGIGYMLFRLLPFWLFILIFCRLFLQSLMMMILYLIKKRPEPQTTLFGKITVAATMILFVIEPAAVIFTPVKAYTLYLEIILGILIGLSFIDKGIYFFSLLHKGPPQGNGPQNP
ncbi:MAG: CDP-alcohol phosphatidyltransferase family protein [Treponema sp.]|jgi:phosphatidylglycerophosphate synthase|nr:CDP-alcohol phosphatidyltransferase family protein [Treponema sp.]